MGREAFRARAVVERDVAVATGDCPTEAECVDFANFRSCRGCPINAFGGKREPGWRESSLTRHVRQIAHDLERGLTVDRASLAPEVLEGLRAYESAVSAAMERMQKARKEEAERERRRLDFARQRAAERARGA